jgi:phosphatidylserine/phosphatidylglycerophosphate/cardiolipin synthase-like enzyme/MFS family permease
MSERNPDLRNFLTGALGYLTGLLGAVLFVILVSRVGLVGWLIGLIDESQVLVQVIAKPIIAGLMLALAGALLGGLGGRVLASILGVPHRRRQVIGSAVAFGVTFSLLTFVYLLLLGFIGIYNNFTANLIDQYVLVFGLFGLVFGLLTGVLQALMSLRLRDTWRLILSSTLGFTLGGMVMGLLVDLANPTSGYRTAPVLTWIVLVLALAAPFAVGGGALGQTYGRLARRAAEKGEPPEAVQPSGWQTGIVAVIGLLGVAWFLGVVDHITDFVTINEGNTQTVITRETVGVQWSDPQPYSGGIEFPPAESNGEMHASLTGPDGSIHSAWCAADGAIQYQLDSGSVESITFPACSGTPALALGSDGQPHVVWYATEIRDATGVTRSDSLLVESIRTPDGWSEASIVARTPAEAVPVLSADADGNLLLVWQDADQNKFSATQAAYMCDSGELSYVEEAGLQSILAGGTRPDQDALPYCDNEFRRFIYTPNPEPAFSSETATPDGAFDKLSADIARLAKYEVLFSTMQYEPSTSPPSPGNVLARGVAELYQSVKANPQDYPRGMTVRILLGNYPVTSTLEWGSQIQDAISDFRAAGVEKMVDPEIGWRLEVANFPGTYPHSHTKFVVIDGKLVTGAGFNYGYLHLPKDHPSGKGYDLLDIGMSIDGPVAQDAISVYDDMWEGSDEVTCADFYPADGSDWQDTCEAKAGVADHVPEVMRYYLPPEKSDHAYSLYRNSVFKESDDFIVAALSSAKERIGVTQANFSLELVCMINLIFPDYCTFEDALPWMDAMVESIQANHTRMRVIMETANSNGLENRVSGQVLMDELKRRGLEDLVELRFYDGKIHTKTVLIDDKLLIVGSQNLHYSAWGQRGLNEYNLATTSPQAIAEYEKFFETKWEQSIPFEEAEYASSP